MSTNEQNENSTETTAGDTASKQNLSNWKERFEELLKVKNLDDLKGELTKLAGELQTEIQTFDIHAHLSPTASGKIKNLETHYNDAMKAIRKTQKQFDREFNKNLRALKKTRSEAQKRFKTLRAKVDDQKSKVLKISKNLRTKMKPKTAKVRKTKKK
jgi:DNA repair exonuclease SbcCD ATPase subunit